MIPQSLREVYRNGFVGSGRRECDGRVQEADDIADLALCTDEWVLERRAGAIRRTVIEAGQEGLQEVEELGCGGWFGFLECLHGLHDVAAEFVEDFVEVIADCPGCLGCYDCVDEISQA